MGEAVLPQRQTYLPIVGREVTGVIFDRLVVGAVTLGFLLLAVAGLACVWAVQENQKLTEQVTHTLQVESSIANVAILVERAESARRGYLLTDAPGFAAVMTETDAAFGPALSKVETLTADNPEQRNRAATLRSLYAQKRAAYRLEQAAIRVGDRARALQLFNVDGARLVRAMRAETADMILAEERLLTNRLNQQGWGVIVLYSILGLTGALVLGVGVASIVIILRYTHDLAESRDRLRELNAGLEGMVRERTADLTRANDEIQRFAYIVSHDLRSPLVNVMGFTSELTEAVGPLHDMITRVDAADPTLVGKEARTAIESDLPEAIGFIRTSTQKMDRLINAILRLSREGRRILTPEPVEVGAVLHGVRASLKHRLDELGAEVIIEEPLPGIVTDRLALEQILSNLIENAVKYGAPGRPPLVTVRGREEAGRIVYEVQDNGRGIDPKDHERIFELFRRSGTQDQPGEGIGLAHVRALSYRLGGLITCESELDRGATFRLSLPAKLTPELAGKS